MEREVKTLEELRDVAREILASLGPQSHAATIGLSGDLGAGKTAFVKELARELDISEEVTSPTFVIMRSYAIPEHPFLKTLTHIDAYRIESSDEMRVLGFSELLHDPSRLLVVEWPERIKDLMPGHTMHLYLRIQEGETRKITYGT